LIHEAPSNIKKRAILYEKSMKRLQQKFHTIVRVSTLVETPSELMVYIVQYWFFILKLIIVCSLLIVKGITEEILVIKKAQKCFFIFLFKDFFG